MRPEDYLRWQKDLEAWLERQPALPAPPWPGESLAGQVARMLGLAQRLAQGIAATLTDGDFRDRNKYDFLLENLERFLSHAEFSLAEYTYGLPGGGHPGLRLFLEERQWRRRVAVLLFEDVRLWRVDEQGGKVSHQLLLLELEPAGISPVWDPGAAEYFQSAWDWSRCLRQALCLPVLLLHP